jgi:hypothetical protein
MTMNRVAAATIFLLAAVVFGSFALAPVHAKAAAADGKLNVLILGDSLALCGFGKRLDERFRDHSQVNATFTYMACATNPLSWLKQKPFTEVKTQCGFWSIESAEGSPQPREVQDTYGIKRNQAPKPRLVPKLEDLLQTVDPDILVVQTGSNLFGLFPDAKTVRPAKDAPALKKYLLPFKQMAIKPPSKLRKIYWVNPPISGRVSKEVQDFVFENVRENLAPAATVIDSRRLVTYPYQHMDPDKEHFLGAQMDEWADKVFDVVQRDLSSQSIAALKPLHETLPAETIKEAAPPAEPPTAQTLTVEAKLVFKSEPMPLKELLPYQESLVSFVYDVKKVINGSYTEKQILVMHPSYIALKKQPLDQYRIGKSYKLKLQPVEGSLWDTAKTRDDSGQVNLQPYIRTDDKGKHPGGRRR